MKRINGQLPYSSVSLQSLDPDSYGYSSPYLDPFRDEIHYYPEFIDDPTFSIVASPDELDEQSVSGDMSHPLADDDTLYNSHYMGLRLYETEEHPFPLDISKDFERAERRW